MIKHDPYVWRDYISQCEHTARELDELADDLCEFPERDEIVLILQRLQALAARVRNAEPPALTDAAIMLLRATDGMRWTSPDAEVAADALRAALPKEMRP